MLVPDGPNHFTARLHLHGQPSLVRGALENSSRAVWLLGPDDRPARVARRLQQEWSEIGDSEKARKLIGSPAKMDMSERFAKLSNLAQAAGVDPAEIKHWPGYNKIVEDTADRLGSGPRAAVLVWKACSSLAHGDLRGVINYLPKELLDNPAPDMVFSRVGPNVSLLAVGTLMAVGTTRRAFDLYRKRAGTLAGGA